jgi:RHS repeat-associated protein
LDGEIVQHIEYVPFGEVFIEERNNTWNTPYLFNAKELDEETGLYYYGARYYDPRVSIWLSADPHAENYYSWSPYHYAGNNPIINIDPDGRDWYQHDENGAVKWSEGSNAMEGYTNIGTTYTQNIGNGVSLLIHRVRQRR